MKKSSKINTALGILWLSILTVVVYMSVTSYNSFKDARSNAVGHAVAFSHLIASHDNYSIKMATALITSLMDHLTDADFNENITDARRKEVEQMLFKHRDRLSGIASFTIIGKNGIRKFGVVNKNFTDLSARPYFKKLKEGIDDTFVSSAEEGLASGKPGIHVAKRFMHNGEFSGVVVINIAIKDVFYPFYTGLNLGHDSTIALFDQNRLIIDYPNSVLVKDRVYHPELVAKIKQGAVRGNAEIHLSNGKNQLVAFEMLEGTNIYAGVGLSLDSIYDTAKQELGSSLLATFMSILAGLFATFAMRTSEHRRHELAESLGVIQHMANHDTLTGLPNRNYLITQFDTMAAQAIQHNETLGLIFIDLDKFKWVNDTLGHATGDVYLQMISERLKKAVGPGNLVSRHGGDEFIVLHSIANDESLDSICKHIMQQVFDEDYLLNTTKFNGGASIGAALLPNDGNTFSELAHHADLAMYQSKKNGRRQYTIYTPELES